MFSWISILDRNSDVISWSFPWHHFSRGQDALGLGTRLNENSNKHNIKLYLAVKFNGFFGNKVVLEKKERGLLYLLYIKMSLFKKTDPKGIFIRLKCLFITKTFVKQLHKLLDVHYQVLFNELAWFFVNLCCTILCSFPVDTPSFVQS